MALFFVAACSSSEEEPEPDAPNTPANSIELVTTSATPGQVVIAKASSKPKITGTTMLKVGGKDVQAIEADSNRVLFILPVLPPGKTVVDYSGVGIDKQVELTIAAYSPITDPTAIANTFTAELGQIADRFQTYVSNPIIKLDPAYIAVLNRQKQILQENFPKLSAQEQMEMAYYLRGAMPNDADFILTPPNPANHRRSSVDPGEALFQTGIAFKDAVINSIIGLSVGVALVYTPDPTFFSKVLAAASLGGGLIYFSKAKALAAEVGSLKGVPESILSDFSNQRLANTAATALRAGEIEFQQGKDKTLQLTGEFRNLVTSDRSSGSALIADIFSYIDKLQEQYNQIIALVNKVRSWFPGQNPDFPGYQNTIQAQAGMNQIALPLQKVSIKNISDASIRLTSTATATGFTQVAQRDAVGLQDKPFSFDIVYADNYTGKTLTKAISAIYKPAQPHTVTITDGNNQQASAGQALPKALKVKVTDKDGKLLKNIEVEWAVKTGGGSLSAPKSTTNAEGIAQVTWTMKAGASGDQQVEATVKKGDGTLVAGTPLTFTADLSLVGLWDLTSYTVNGSDYFHFQDRGNRICGEVSYQDKEKFLTSTFNITNTGSIAWTSVIEKHSFNFTPVGNDCKMTSPKVTTSTDAKTFTYVYDATKNEMTLNQTMKGSVSLQDGVLTLSFLSNGTTGVPVIFKMRRRQP